MVFKNTYIADALEKTIINIVLKKHDNHNNENI